MPKPPPKKMTPMKPKIPKGLDVAPEEGNAPVEPEAAPLPEESEDALQESPYMNEAEAEVHKGVAEELSSKPNVSTTIMDNTVSIASAEFHLSGKKYTVTGFGFKKGACMIDLSNRDFSIAITIHNPEKFGINPEEGE